MGGESGLVCRRCRTYQEHDQPHHDEDGANGGPHQSDGDGPITPSRRNEHGAGPEYEGADPHRPQAPADPPLAFGLLQAPEHCLAHLGGEPALSRFCLDVRGRDLLDLHEVLVDEQTRRLVLEPPSHLGRLGTELMPSGFGKTGPGGLGV